MVRKATRGAQGAGSIRQRKDGLWEARYTVERDPQTGKQRQKSVYGKTQKEVRQKLTAITNAIDTKEYIDPSKMTVAQWLKEWLDNYTADLKPYSLRNYRSQMKNHVIPNIGAIKVQYLSPDMIQRMYNHLRNQKGLAPKTLRNIHGILHRSLNDLVECGKIKSNPATLPGKHLPKIVKQEMEFIADAELAKFMAVIKGNPYENLFLVDLFTGLRQGELLGLRWSCVDFARKCITVDKQLYMPEKGGEYSLQSLKNSKTRIIYPASFVFDTLRRERLKQNEARLIAGELWDEGNLPGLVFTNEFGKHLSHKTVYKRFKTAAEEAGIPTVRFHDMRHSYAVASLRSGDDVKTVQENLGHATAAFTLNVYGHVTDDMRKESAARMEQYINSIQAAK